MATVVVKPSTVTLSLAMPRSSVPARSSVTAAAEKLSAARPAGEAVEAPPIWATGAWLAGLIQRIAPVRAAPGH